MKEHSEVVRDYIELRNYLARSNPRPNMEFEIQFKVENGSLMAFNSLSKAKVELARIRSGGYPGIFLPHYGSLFEIYSASLIDYVNEHLVGVVQIEMENEVVRLASVHKGSLNLAKAYEPKD